VKSRVGRHHRKWFLAPTKDNHFIAGARNGLYDFDPSSGSFALIRTVEPDRPGNRLNDDAVDLRGRLWFGSMDDGGKKRDRQSLSLRP